MSDTELAPIIIKRKKVIKGGGHHGGAWKVAYADFVTAMMAFFMLMWLLNATTETQRKGLADYFSPTIAVARISGGGDGAFGGDSLFSENTMSQSGRGGFVETEGRSTQDAGSTGAEDGAQAAETETLEGLQAGLMGKGGESLVVEMALEHIVTRVTDEGLVIEVFDLEGRPLFDPVSEAPTPIMIQIGQLLSEVFAVVENDISITGHSRTYPVVAAENRAWEITTQRAHSVRELLEASGFPEARISRLTGYGQSKPLLQDAMHAGNNRLEVTLLRKGKG
jgi:chemotaxis protein MotB